MKKLVLIDGINFYFKGSYVGELDYNGKKVQYIYAFLKNLLSLMKKMEMSGDFVRYVVCWDGGYKERLRISQQAVEKGIIQKTYKQERRQSKQLLSQQEKAKNEQFMKQLRGVQELLSYTKIQQERIVGQEADDVIGSFVYKYKDIYDEVIVVTSDKDYFQLLQPNVKIYNSIKKIYIDRQYLKQNYGIEDNKQWVDIGALAGELGSGSDTIYGVKGISYKSGSKLIQKYNSLQNLLNKTKEYFQKDIQHYGSVELLKQAVSKDEYKIKEMKKQFSVLQNKEIVLLAYQLKKMRTFLQVYDKVNSSDWQKLDDFLRENGFHLRENEFELLLMQNKMKGNLF